MTQALPELCKHIAMLRNLCRVHAAIWAVLPQEGGLRGRSASCREARGSRLTCSSRASSAQMGAADEVARRSQSSCARERSAQMEIADKVDVTCSVDQPSPTKCAHAHSPAFCCF